MKNNNGYNNMVVRDGDRFFDPFFGDFFFPTSRSCKDMERLMKTDVEETEKGYVLSMEVPGFKKEEIDLQLKNGYLTVSASHCESSCEGENKKKFVRKERSCSSMKRSFYVGEDVSEGDVEASLENGVLKVDVKKPEKKLPESKKILIK